MTQKDIELLVKQFNGFRIKTYAELNKTSRDLVLHQALLATNNRSSIIAIRVSEHPVEHFYSDDAIALRLKVHPTFEDKDTFKLTEYGEDVLYQLNKEIALDLKAEKNLRIGIFSAVVTSIAAITGIISVIK